MDSNLGCIAQNVSGTPVLSSARQLFKQLQVCHSLAYIIDRVNHQREKSNAECNPGGPAGKPGNVDLCYFNCLYYIPFSSGTLNSILPSVSASQIAELFDVEDSRFP